MIDSSDEFCQGCLGEKASSSPQEGGHKGVFVFVALIFVAPMVVLLIYGIDQMSSIPSYREQQDSAVTEKRAFVEQIDRHYADFKGLLAEEKFDEADAIFRQFKKFGRIEYKDLLKLRSGYVLSEVPIRFEGAQELANRISFFKKMSEEQPDNKEYKAEFTKWKKRGEVEKAYLEQVQHHFSDSDSSHNNLTAYVVASLRHPESYLHLETKCWAPTPQGLYTVRCIYSAKNNYGGQSKKSIRVKVHLETGKIAQVVTAK